MQLGVEADARAVQDVEDRLQRRALGVEQQLGAGVEDAQVAEHLALGREQRRVAAAASVEASTSFVTWPLRNAFAPGAGERELAALGAVEQPARLADDRGRRRIDVAGFADRQHED